MRHTVRGLRHRMIQAMCVAVLTPGLPLAGAAAPPTVNRPERALAGKQWRVKYMPLARPRSPFGISAIIRPSKASLYPNTCTCLGLNWPCCLLLVVFFFGVDPEDDSSESDQAGECRGAASGVAHGARGHGQALMLENQAAETISAGGVGCWTWGHARHPNTFRG